MASVEQIIRAVAQSLGVDPDLAVADATVESGLNPTAVGDQGTSFGLFQLHRGGELGNLTPQQAFDPQTNATVALQQFKNVQRSYPNVTDPGQIAALAQRPADPQGYARKVDQAYTAVQQKKTNSGGSTLSTILGAAGSALTGSAGGSPAGVAGLGLSAAAKPAQTISDVAGFFGWITDSHNWLRLGEILAGGVLMLVGVVATAMVLSDRDVGDLTSLAGLRALAK